MHGTNINDLMNTPIEDLTFSIVDTETTGMHPDFCKVMDIGIVTVKNGQIIDEWEALIDPKQKISNLISYYTKIQDYDVINKPTFEYYSSEIIRRLEGTIFVGHNVNFDYRFLFSEMKRLGKNFHHPKICTVLLSRKLLPQLSSANLDTLSDYYQIKISQRHRALPDAQATAIVLNKFIEIAKEKYKVKNFFDLEKLQWLSVNPSKNYTNNFNDMFSTLE